MQRRTFVAASLAALAAPAMARAQTPEHALPPAAAGPAIAAPQPIPMITAQNALERAFLAALEDEAARPEFRRQLLESRVAMALSSTSPDAPPRQITLRPGVSACLIFTSSARAASVMGPTAPRVVLTGREALTRARGTNVVININLAPRLVLEAEDIEQYLAMPAAATEPATPPPAPPSESAGPAQ